MGSGGEDSWTISGTKPFLAGKGVSTMSRDIFVARQQWKAEYAIESSNVQADYPGGASDRHNEKEEA